MFDHFRKKEEKGGRTFILLGAGEDAVIKFNDDRCR